MRIIRLVRLTKLARMFRVNKFIAAIETSCAINYSLFQLIEVRGALLLLWASIPGFGVVAG